MKITFLYDPAYEFDNLQRGRGIYSQESQTEFVRSLLEAGTDMHNPEAVMRFAITKIGSERIPISNLVRDLQRSWDAVEPKVITGLNTLFATDYPFASVTGRLSLNSRCAYNPVGHYFYLNAFSENPVGSTIHELMHLYTHAGVEILFKEHGASEAFGDFKEALTVLINYLFADCINRPDRGYAMHADLRAWIETTWQEGMTVQELARLYLHSHS